MVKLLDNSLRILTSYNVVVMSQLAGIQYIGKFSRRHCRKASTDCWQLAKTWDRLMWEWFVEKVSLEWRKKEEEEWMVKVVTKV